MSLRLSYTLRAYTKVAAKHADLSRDLFKASSGLRRACEYEFDTTKEDEEPKPMQFQVHIREPEGRGEEIVGPRTVRLVDTLLEAMEEWHRKHGDEFPPRLHAYVYAPLSRKKKIDTDEGEFCISPHDAGRILREETGKDESVYPDALFAWKDKEVEFTDDQCTAEAFKAEAEKKILAAKTSIKAAAAHTCEEKKTVVDNHTPCVHADQSLVPEMAAAA